MSKVIGAVVGILVGLFFCMIFPPLALLSFLISLVVSCWVFFDIAKKDERRGR